MTVLLLTILALGASAFGAFTLAVNARLRYALHIAQAELRQAKLEAGHAVDAATIPGQPIAENVATIVEAGVFKPGGILGRAKPPVVLALLLATIPAIPARAADILPIGTAISTTAGEIVILDDEYTLIDRGEVANIAIMVRDLERCRAALAECDASGRPVEVPVLPAKSGLGWWVAAITGAFAAGLVAGEVAR